MYYQNIKIILLIMVAAIWLSACGTDVGGNEDKTKPSTTIDAIVDENDTDGEIIGTATIQWTTDEVNRSTVDIFLSGDAGETFETTIELNVPDTGEYVWDTNTVADCRTCRLRIIPTDVVGNFGDPAESEEDFIINNVPQVLGTALFFDTGVDAVNTVNNGIGCGDDIRIPFDKDIEIRLPIGRDMHLPVAGDRLGSNAFVTPGPGNNEITVTLDDSLCGSLGESDFHLHLGGIYQPGALLRTNASGIDIINDLPLGVITAVDTGRTAQPSAFGGIDIAPTYSAGEITGFLTGNIVAVVIADFDDNKVQDAVLINTSGVQSVYEFNGSTFTSFPVGAQVLGNVNNTSVAVGNVDGINGPDVIVGNTNANLVYYNNNNDGDFITQTPASLGSSNTNAVALGNIDSIPGLDLIVANNGENRVWRNDGSGNFSEDGSPQLLGNNDSRAIKLADIDNDNDLDLIFGNFSTGNRVFLNDGSGVFSDTGQTLGGSDTLSLAVGDIDGDGDIDFVTGNDNVQANRVWMNDGAGQFSDANQSLGTNKAYSIELADVDGDGDLDVITGNDNDSNRQNRVWFNNGAGIFSDSGQALGTNKTRSLHIVDFEGDGDIDFLEGVSDNVTTSTIWLNSQRHSSQPILLDSKQSLGDSDTRSVATGDVDGDGDLDFVSANFNQGNRIWTNDGNAIFTATDQTLGSNATQAVLLVDVDNDNDLDMLTAVEGVGANRVWLNNSTGVFSDSGQELGNSDTISLAAGDIDNDGDIDFITANVGQANRVWRNDGNGNYFESDIPVQTLGTALTVDVKLGDVDGDNDLDIVAGNLGQPDQVWINSGFNSGIFVADQSISSGSNLTFVIALGDIDNDGDLDLVSGGSLSDNLVWINNGSNSNMFTGPQILANSDSVRSVMLLDIDNDNDLDLLIGKSGAPNELLLNDGSGTFVSAPDFDDNDTNAFAAGDMDADNDIDIIVGNGGGQSNRVWLNDY